jgi:ribosome biogenesis GTPase / thiamine phosphate phosphatase
VRLEQLGWNSYFEAEWNAKEHGMGRPARVLAQHRELWQVAGEFGVGQAGVLGKLRLAAEAGGDWPAVGDWVCLEGEGSGEAAIREVLPRWSRIARKSAGKKSKLQVLAANCDSVFLMMGLDGDFNLRRLERYLALAWKSRARPVVVLNKRDICAEPDVRVRQVEQSAPGVTICTICATSGIGLDALRPYIRTGQTVALLGSSGVGKSTLVNHFLGEEHQAVQGVRECDSRGRHTTTARQLFFLSTGAMMIDTPGLRELHLWDAQEGLQQVFSDVAERAKNCRFRNCSHSGEPGCAVQDAVDRGKMDESRLVNHRKLQREQAFLSRKMDADAQQKERQRIRKLSRAVRQFYEQRKKDGRK